MLEAAVLCLALNAYHEARRHGPVEMAAVTQVVLERVGSKDPRWPADVCAAVRQGGPRPLHRCQFSWYCDGRSDRPREARPWREAQIVAAAMLAGHLRVPSLAGATCYHARNMPAPPRWAGRSRPVGATEGHLFYSC